MGWLVIAAALCHVILRTTGNHIIISLYHVVLYCITSYSTYCIGYISCVFTIHCRLFDMKVLFKLTFIKVLFLQKNRKCAFNLQKQFHNVLIVIIF